MISNAATDAKNVVGLVFVAAFATDEGETVGEVASTSKDAILSTALVQLHYPVGDGAETAVELGVDPAKFRDVVAADLPAEQTAVMAATQRPIAELAFSEPCGPPAWKNLPVLGHCRDRRQGRRRGPRPLAGRARRSHDHRGRGLARDHDLAARGCGNVILDVGAVAQSRWS